MGANVRRFVVTVAIAVAAVAVAHSTSWAAFSLRWPFGHHDSHEWTQF